MYSRNFEESRQRALEASRHDAEYTFISPTTLLHLIAVHKSFLRIRRLVEQHWETAEKEQGAGYSDRDLWLWSQALNWHD